MENSVEKRIYTCNVYYVKLSIWVSVELSHPIASELLTNVTFGQFHVTPGAGNPTIDDVRIA